MPRQTRAPVPLPEFRYSTSEAEVLARFREQAGLAAVLFQIDPEAGRRRAVQAAWWLILDLTDAPDVLAPFASLAEVFHLRWSGRKDVPARWKSTARIAAAVDGLMKIGVRPEEMACKAVLNVPGVSVVLKASRTDNLNWGTVRNLRTRYLNQDADPAAVMVFDDLRAKYARDAQLPWSIAGKKYGILEDLRRNLARLAAEDVGKQSDV